MKKLCKIYANTTIPYGSALLDRDGNLIEVAFHVPSTTYISRGIKHLCCTDAQFLYEHNYITQEDVAVITKYCFHEYLTDPECGGKSDDNSIGVVDSVNFNAYAELRYANESKGMVMSLRGQVGDLIGNGVERKFQDLNKKWYSFLQNNYVKVSNFKNVVEFRIGSTDGFDWNKVIIDDCILKYDKGNGNTKYNIIKEVGQTYKVYFMQSTLSDLLSDDKAVLSSRRYTRKVVNGKMFLVPVR